MSTPPFDGPTLLALGAYLVAGILAGILYFTCLWWNARLLAERGRTWMTILLVPGRVVILGGVLTLAAHEGALPLLLMSLGVCIARFAVMRGLRAAAP